MLKITSYERKYIVFFSNEKHPTVCVLEMHKTFVFVLALPK